MDKAWCDQFAPPDSNVSSSSSNPLEIFLESAIPILSPPSHRGFALKYPLVFPPGVKLDERHFHPVPFAGMGNFGDDFQQELKTQSWSLYSVGMVIVLLRIAARIKRLGIRNLQLDDYLMLAVGSLFTLLIVCLNVTADGGGSNLYPPELEGTFTESEIRARIYGSKIVVVSEQAMLNLIYLIKVCMLLMYTRLTLGLHTQRLVRVLGVYVFLGWMSTEITFFAACRPFKGYWGMPPPDPQCTTYEHYAIVQAVFNISSDVLMLFIPMPLIIKLHAPLPQKLVLSCIFSMGLFVIIAAALTKYFNLSDLWNSEYMLWYVREASVAVYVSNLPLIWPLVLEVFPGLRKWTTGRSIEEGPSGEQRRHATNGSTAGMRTNISSHITSVPAKTFDRLRRKRRNSLGSIDSLEMTYRYGAGNGRKSGDKKHSGDDTSSTENIFRGIQVERTVEVQEEAGRRRSPGDDAEKGQLDWGNMGGLNINISSKH
ncbi:hypothetical protein MKZ38_007964 [Zalerion maritima]|uniref:Rhodopsin domain-containing protein n=1 Tax=Zalerion maritima TaxID=339359 RepID=A0AAD5RI13_9PEZI|nr:hypothetical protein MKZ38_007964 [Zalerion maritima]